MVSDGGRQYWVYSTDTHADAHTASHKQVINIRDSNSIGIDTAAMTAAVAVAVDADAAAAVVSTAAAVAGGRG